MTEHPSDVSAMDNVADRRVVRRRVVGFSVAVIVLTVFFIGVWLNVHYRLPDENDPAVKADTARAARAIEGYFASSTKGATSAGCTVRLLDRTDAGALYAHAVCVARPGPTQDAGPYSVAADGTVHTARTGDRFDSDVKAMFGARLGDWYLNHRHSFDWMRPPDAPGSGVGSPVPGG